MTTATDGKMPKAVISSSSFSNTLSSWLVRLGGLAIVDAVALWLLYSMFRDGIWQLGLVIAIVTLLLNVIFLREELYPLRWISPGLALLVALVVYPIVSTVYLAFTNYGDGHLLEKSQAIERITAERYLNEDATVFEWTAYVDQAGDYLLWLQSPDGNEIYIARPGQALETASGDPPDYIEGFQQLNKIERLQHTETLVLLEFGAGDNAFQVSNQQIGKAARFQRRYIYDAEQDAIVDQAADLIYTPVEGTFTAADGATLIPGYRVAIGADNFARMFTSRALFEPFLWVFLWTVVFAVLSAASTFVLGLFLAIMFDVPEMPFQRVLRSLMLVPYAVPGFISVPIWRGLLNPQFGVISQMMIDVFGYAPPWFSDPTWAKVGILLINLWLGFPYMFVICTGALQALPTDIYEAADIDGASAWAKFRSMTLPLLMISIGPMLVASFAFNFNNFAIVYLYNEGGPPMSGTAAPVGWTDILVSYTFRTAFASGRGADLGYAAALAVMIFAILLVITFFQFRYTNMLEERSENV